jgi:hypothetical protein
VPIINCTINSSNFYIKIFFEKQLFSMELIAKQTHLKFNSREKKRKIQKRRSGLTYDDDSALIHSFLFKEIVIS